MKVKYYVIFESQETGSCLWLPGLYECAYHVDNEESVSYIGNQLINRRLAKIMEREELPQQPPVEQVVLKTTQSLHWFEVNWIDGMLDYSGYGWVTFRLGSFIREISGISPILMDCVNAFIKVMKRDYPILIFSDEEGAEIFLTLDNVVEGRTFIIESNACNQSQLYTFNMNHVQLAKLFLEDVERDFEKYLADNYFFDLSTE